MLLTKFSVFEFFFVVESSILDLTGSVLSIAKLNAGPKNRDSLPQRIQLSIIEVSNGLHFKFSNFKPRSFNCFVKRKILEN